LRPLAGIGEALDRLTAGARPTDADTLLQLGEEVLEHWVTARGKTPTDEAREGFRLLALHRQGADKEPSFNACRETCRELAWHYNLLKLRPDHPEAGKRARMMALVCNHLYLFVSGKMEVEQLGDFCCASRPIRQTVDESAKAH
jgi:hypothetical protein